MRQMLAYGTCVRAVRDRRRSDARDVMQKAFVELLLERQPWNLLLLES